MGENRGSIAFFTTYRPPVPLDIYSYPISPTSFHHHHELQMTDGDPNCYNYNGHAIPPNALKTMLNHPKLASLATHHDVDSGRVSGMVFVSERTNNLETVHIALRIKEDDQLDNVDFKVLSFSDVYGTFDGVRMEDSGCIAGSDYLVYVSTMDNLDDSRQPWTVVYKTHLSTGKTERLTPSFQADLSPSVSPSGKQIAVASFQKRGGWNGERESLKTDIFVMNIEKQFKRRMVIKDGGWPTWGSDNIIFFHRKVGDNWVVFRAEINTDVKTHAYVPPLVIEAVTPLEIDAITPAAIDATTVAVVAIHQKSKLSKFTDSREESQYRHIEIYDATKKQRIEEITRQINPKADHYNPFVIQDINGGKHIGYHRCTITNLKDHNEVSQYFDKVKSPPQLDLGLFRVSGVFPTFSKDGAKLVFVDNNFKDVWLADKDGLRRIHQTEGSNKVFSTVWNQNPDKDILYVCMGPSFSADNRVDICAIIDASAATQQRKKLTRFSNNAFPSTNPDGTKLVFRSTRDSKGDKIYKNLYIMDAEYGEYGSTENKITRLTEGPWVDTHCKWSPKGDWIVFSSNRDRPDDAIKGKEDLDSGYYSIYLVNANDHSVVVRVIGSGSDFIGHVNHPFFSPDGKSIVVASDLAAVSVDPISLPLFLHSARPYGDIFTIDIDPDNIHKNKNLKRFNRITHSRYENSTGIWTDFSTHDPRAAWNQLLYKHNKKTWLGKLGDLAEHIKNHKKETMLITSLLSLVFPPLIPYALILMSAVVIIPMLRE